MQPRESVWRLFNDIAARYDIVNRILSLGLDIAWRRRLAASLSAVPQLRIADIACGTGDVLLSVARARARSLTGAGLQYAAGVDLAAGMMTLARRKFVGTPLCERTVLLCGDAVRLPFRDGAFDAATIAFGIRNVSNPVAALGEMRRVVRPGGQVLILEFSLPRNGMVRHLHGVYLRHLLPILGGVLTGHYEAYRYLAQSIAAFPHGEAFCAIMRSAGLTGVAAHPLTFGVATLYTGQRPGSETGSGQE